MKNHRNTVALAILYAAAIVLCAAMSWHVALIVVIIVGALLIAGLRLAAPNAVPRQDGSNPVRERFSGRR